MCPGQRTATLSALASWSTESWVSWKVSKLHVFFLHELKVKSVLKSSEIPFFSVTPTKSSGISASAIGGVCSRDITAKSSIFPQKWYRLPKVWRFHLAVKYVIVTSDSFHSLYSFFSSDLLTLTTFVRRYAYCTILKVIDLLENSSSTRTKFWPWPERYVRLRLFCNADTVCIWDCYYIIFMLFLCFRQDVGEGWWEGVGPDGSRGLFPEAYVEVRYIG